MNRPGAFPEKIRGVLGIRIAFDLPIEVGKRFGGVTDQERIEQLGQVPNLRLVKFKFQIREECNQLSRLLYNNLEHGLPPGRMIAWLL